MRKTQIMSCLLDVVLCHNYTICNVHYNLMKMWKIWNFKNAYIWWGRYYNYRFKNSFETRTRSVKTNSLGKL